MTKPLISVVVPLYRVEAEMPLCVDSVLAQTYDRLDVILVDDGSPDGCGRLAEDYARRDARVRAIHRENGGLSRRATRARWRRRATISPMWTATTFCIPSAWKACTG